MEFDKKKGLYGGERRQPENRKHGIPQEYCLPILWIKSKNTGRKHLITDFENDCVWIGSVSIKFKDLYEHYTWLDDSPCGIKDSSLLIFDLRS